MRRGDLVVTADGYYGIVVGEREVFLGNGLQEIMIPEDWPRLKVLPINVNHEDGAVSNFDALVEGRAPCQAMPVLGSESREGLTRQFPEDGPRDQP